MADASLVPASTVFTRLNRLAAWFAARGTWQRMGLSALAGIATVAAMPPLGFWPILFVAFPVFVWLLDGTGAPIDPATGWRGRFANWGATFATGWAYGFGFFLVGLYWIGNAFLVEADTFGWMIPFVAVLMPGGLALFFGAATVAARAVAREGIARVLVLAIAWALVEWLRGHILTGFPWNALGYAFVMSDTLVQTASLIGLYGLTLIAALVAMAPAMLAGPGTRHDMRTLATALVLALGLPVLMWGWGALRLSASDPAPVPGVMLRIVQPNIPQTEKWLPERRASNLARVLRLTRGDGPARDAAAAGVTHVIWPESATPFLLDQNRDARTLIADALPPGAVLLTGAVRADPYPQPRPNGVWADFYNSAMVIDGAGNVGAVYDKAHLVPFGEYLPMQGLLEAIGMEQLTRQRGGYSSGPGPATIAIPNAPDASVLICYEIIFPGAVAASPRPGWLVNVTNDAWFGDSIGPRQHLHQARMRAVEEGLPVIRAANTGVSTVIDAHGRILVRLGLGEMGIIDTALPGSLPPTLYSRVQDLAFLFLLAVTAIGTYVVVSINQRHA